MANLGVRMQRNRGRNSAQPAIASSLMSRRKCPSLLGKALETERHLRRQGQWPIWRRKRPIRSRTATRNGAKSSPPSSIKCFAIMATERPGSCALNYEKRAGTFSCAGCGQELFKAGRKFESGTGWPSFNDPLPGAVETTEDRSLGMLRTEVHCSRCGGHLGHVFPGRAARPPGFAIA